MWELIFLEEGINITNTPGKAYLKKGIKPIFLTRNSRIIDLISLNILEICVFAKLFEWRKYLFCVLCKILGQTKIFQFLLTVMNHYQNSTFSWSMFYYVYILTWTSMLVTACFCHVTFAFQSESTLYSCLNVKELLARSRRKLWSLQLDSNSQPLCS